MSWPVSVLCEPAQEVQIQVFVQFFTDTALHLAIHKHTQACHRRRETALTV
jgi:hypothetical protein